MPGAAHDASKQRRAQRLLANVRLDVARAQRRLAARVLSRRHGRVDLLLDATTTGATAHQAGTTTRCFALAWHQRAVPLVWRTWRADAPGQDWQAAIRELAQVLQALLPADAQVVVLADRGLSGSPLARLCREVGWHFLLRVTRHARVRRTDGSVCPLMDLVPQPGTRCCLQAVTLYAPRHKQRPAAGGWVSDWSAGLVAQVVAVWRRQQAGTQPEEAWLLVTDLPATLARCSEYRRCTWEEELFRDLKDLGWQWQQSRVRRPERVARLLLVLALATLWIVALAQRVVGRGWRPLLEARAPLLQCLPPRPPLSAPLPRHRPPGARHLPALDRARRSPKTVMKSAWERGWG